MRIEYALCFSFIFYSRLVNKDLAQEVRERENENSKLTRPDYSMTNRSIVFRIL